MKILVRGVTYGSVREAAEALGMSIHGIYSGLDRGSPDMLGLGKTKAKPVTLEGITFRSMTAASIALGFPPRYLREALLRGSTNARERVAFAAKRYAAKLEMDAERKSGGKLP
ncbi:hypothetical protein UFOVP68_38 [uncultured Caudovirales phage]|uniref:Uncharacterized protein n=1 Tax=uncultured Caudovirales phage TaxID=2100421 RepID=A0A6J5KYX1_9CAUD|nr:hypothetical protein UFOVP68_38 [uncultured Caudovirales phage]